VIREAHIVCIESLQSRSPASTLLAQLSSKPLPLHASSIGKIMLAHRDWHEVLQLLDGPELPSYTRNTITSLTELAQALRQVREQGYACDREEILMGLCAISAPIHNASGHVIAGIAILVPASRFYQQETSYAAIILDAARHISRGLGYYRTNTSIKQHISQVKENQLSGYVECIH
jgi:DNA-binding IclR family transcriptional regulator